MSIDLIDAISCLKEQVPEPSEGLPDEIFYYVSSVTPLVNVDLLIKDESGRTLFSWRDDEHSGVGWHLPGGIIRIKETMEERLRKVSFFEIGLLVKCEKAPIDINEIIYREKEFRAHFISFLFRCSLPLNFVPDNKGKIDSDPGYLRWHVGCPDNLLPCHDLYRKYF